MYTDNNVTPEIIIILFTQSNAIMSMQYFNKYAMNFQEILQNSSRIPGIPVDFQDIQGC